MSTFTIFLALIVIVAFLLVVVIMVQNPKGGGLSSSFGGSGQQVGGVKKTGDFLDKSTWTLATLLLVLILLSNVTIMDDSGYNESRVFDEETMPENTTTPPAQMPVQQPESDN
jgi:preprotein translocase subunit SecG